MNLSNEQHEAIPDEQNFDDSLEELINSRQRQRYQIKSSQTIDQVKIFVRLEKHKESFNFKPKHDGSFNELFDYFYDKNSPNIKEIYPKKELRVFMANHLGKKKNYPGLVHPFSIITNSST